MTIADVTALDHISVLLTDIEEAWNSLSDDAKSRYLHHQAMSNDSLPTWADLSHLARDCSDVADRWYEAL